MQVTATDFEFIRDFARKHAAIVLESGKEYLVESRLAPLARTNGFPDLSAFIGHLRNQRTVNGVHTQVIDALTTNETLFFRDFHPFEALRKELVPALMKSNAVTRCIRIWSAACSTGQEPYSIAMLLKENFPELDTWRVQIIGTDLSRTVLQQARLGSYSQLEVNRGLPAKLLIKYFVKQADRWVVNDEIKRMVEFRELNLVQTWAALPAFDIVMLRNVMIYFDEATKAEILRKLKRQLAPHGCLFLGTAETTLNIDPSYERITIGSATAYRPNEGVRLEVRNILGAN